MNTGETMNVRKVKFAGLAVLAMLVFASTFHAQQMPGPGEKPATVMPDVLQVPAAAQPSAHFDADAATEAYLAQIPASARSRSDAYFEGGYWLIL
jgi:hypothetical protein